MGHCIPTVRFVLTICLLAAAAARGQEPATKSVDIAIYGGTASGVIAAVAAKKEGKSILLIEPGRHLGGMTSGGLSWTDFGNKAAIGGMSLDFYKRIGKAYGKDEAAWTFEPHVAEKVLEDLIAESKVDVIREHRLFAVDTENNRITRITLENAPPLPHGGPAPERKEGSPPLFVKAKIYLDCTYEGDLLARANVGYTVGRESAEQYGEPLNGIRAKTPAHQFKTHVSPYVKPGDPTSGLISMIPSADPEAFGTPGDSDHRVQAYNFRLCLTKTPANRIEIGAPPGYDPARYELLARHIGTMVADKVKFDLKSLLKIDMVTKEKTDINNQGAVSTDYIGASYAYPDADWPTRSKIWGDHVNYVQGILYFLGHSERIPQAIRDDMLGWGFCKDEFTDTAGWPHQLYVREARRMIGRYVITQKDCDHQTTIDDAVGLGAYNMDSHNCQRVVVKDPAGDYVMNEGDVQVAPRGPYKLGYAAITPKQEECENLIVPVCLSATHIAYGSARMEPVFMVLGQSAAVAASMAIDANKPVQQVDVKGLQQKLLKAGQVLEPPAGSVKAVSAGAGSIEAGKLGGVVVDDDDVAHLTLTGDWVVSTGKVGIYVGQSYLHDNNQSKGQMSAMYTLRVPEPGIYDVRLYYSANPNRATNVPVTMTVGDATEALTVNQRKAAASGPSFAKVGRAVLKAGEAIKVEVGNAGTDGYVILDAVQAVKVN